jgi:hypothetical protein
MFHSQPDQPLPADLVTDDATAWAYAFGLQPTVGASAAPATITAHMRGQGLFVRVVVDEDLPTSERELVGDLARAEVIRLLREGTAGGGWTCDPTAEVWTATVQLPDDVRVVVPDHVPDEWTRAA